MEMESERVREVRNKAVSADGIGNQEEQRENLTDLLVDVHGNDTHDQCSEANSNQQGSRRESEQCSENE